MSSWPECAKVAFIGSHGIRKTTAVHAFANTMQRAGRSVEHGREVIRDNPLGINESASGEAQLWVIMSQIRQEIRLSRNAEVLVLDRGVMDNFAYYLRASGGEDPFDVGPLVAKWSKTYDMVVRLRPDIELREDGVRSTSDDFRDEIEAILDAELPGLVAERRLVEYDASSIGDSFDWWPLAERLADLMEQPLFADGVPRRKARRTLKPKPEIPQLEMEM
ncbi:MAG: ATP-binding protein [Actinomycetota bacterium]|nr:ATP-binding protein [Actinomycetota bacterium]MDK1017415.1 ATP-binding protein [Actinomycetota bacterium]MDK1027251.1 ATP-binding protein [Actinomycetota bacterium]MDK1039033.1 ATP-binding protein [Actinomycetota bacterium]MDK1096453.1 ATP-binding protein [Actinomycetota bacterium]